MTAGLSVELRHTFLSGFRVDVAFELPLASGGTAALVGVSGSGKTTVLRALAGLDEIDQGRIEMGGQIWLDTARRIFLPPQQRGVGCLFQEYALFPHLTVAQNIAFGLQGLPRAEQALRVAELLKLLQLPGIENRRPGELSGGQQQRVALARAVAGRPKLLLLDEPLSALDTPTRGELRGLLRGLLDSQGIPALVVTHDASDVRALCDRVVVLDAGKVLQSGPRDELLSATVHERVVRLLSPEVAPTQGTDARECTRHVAEGAAPGCPAASTPG